MIPLLSQATLAFPVSAAVYFIVSLQLSVGFPPFYVPLGSRNIVSLDRLLFFVFAMMSAMMLFAITKITIIFFAFGCIGAAGGIDVRGCIKKKVSKIGLSPWIWSSITLKWPMLVFDVWTIGASFYVFWVLL